MKKVKIAIEKRARSKESGPDRGLDIFLIFGKKCDRREIKSVTLIVIVKKVHLESQNRHRENKKLIMILKRRSVAKKVKRSHFIKKS